MGFNSLDQALAKAQVQKTEASVRRTPIYLIVGLDFGTAYTKCMVRDFNYRGSNKSVLPLSFGSNGEATYFLPSELGWANGKLIHALDGIPDSVPVLAFLKMALAAAATGVRSDWLDGVARPIGAIDSHQQLASVRALVVYYLIRVLRVVQDSIAAHWKDFGDVQGDTVFYNMAVPVAQARDEAVLGAFREVLEVAVSIASSGKEIPQSLDEMITLVEKHRGTELDICDIMPEVTANVQSYVRSRGGRHGLYLFADVGAGTVDYSVFIYYPQDGDRALTYPHAAVEHLGSSQLEMRTFQRSQVAIMRQLRLIKEGKSKTGAWSTDLAKELDETRAEIEREIAAATERVIYFTRKKINRRQFQTMQILYGGGGWSPAPYAKGVEKAFDSRWGLSAVSQPLPVPSDVDWPTGEGANLFRRFSVAYGLSSFFSKDPPIQRFPDEIAEFDPEDRPRAVLPSAPSKDEV